MVEVPGLRPITQSALRIGREEASFLVTAASVVSSLVRPRQIPVARDDEHNHSVASRPPNSIKLRDALRCADLQPPPDRSLTAAAALQLLNSTPHLRSGAAIS